MADILKIDLSSERHHRAPFDDFARLRAAGPVARVRLPLIGPVWITATRAAAETMLKDRDAFVSEPRNAGRADHGLPWWTPREARLMTRSMILYDEPEHRRLRRLVDGAFHRREIAELEPMIAAAAEPLVADLAARIARGETVDLADALARPLPLAVIAGMLGLAAADSARLQRRLAPLTAASGPLGAARALLGLRGLVSDLGAHVAAARAGGGRPGLIRDLAAAEADGARLSDDEMVSTVLLLFAAGHETTAHLISGGVWALLTHPEQAARWRGGEATTAAVVEELLRWLSPVQSTKPRYAARDLTLAGTPIARGERVAAHLGAANADPEAFASPERLDFGRAASGHLAFGAGIHFCLGLQLARAEGRIALDMLFERVPDLALAPGRAARFTRRFGLRGLTRLSLTRRT